MISTGEERMTSWITFVHPETNDIPWHLEQQILKAASPWLSTNISHHLNSQKLQLTIQ
jgi:hypothetical protein